MLLYLADGFVCPAVNRDSGGRADRHHPVRFAARQHDPDDAGILGRQCHRCPFVATAGDQFAQPAADSILLVLERGQYRTCAVDQQHAQVLVALFGDAPQAGLAAGAVLPWHQPQPGGQLPSVVELGRVGNAGDQRGGGDRANAGQAHQAPGGFAVARQVLDLAVVGEHLMVERLDTLVNVMQQPARQTGQAVAGVFEDVGDVMLGGIAPLGHDEAEFGEQAAQLVDLCGALGNDGAADAMQAEDGLLLDGFDGNEAHGGTADGFADGLGVVAVILAALAVGDDKARGDDAGVVPEIAQSARPMVGAAAGFHADDAGRQIGEAFEQLAAREGLLQHRLAVRIDAVHTEYVLGQVNSYGSNIHDGLSSSFD